MTPAATPPPIPDHTVLRIIGRGSFGEIWLARSLTGAFRAVKAVYRASFESERSFAREFEGMSSFEPISREHDGFVDILHVGRSETFFYYIMELADDDATGSPLRAAATPEEIAAYAPKTLKTELDRRKHLPIEEALMLGASLAGALDDLHTHRLTHRDIKPANIIFVEGNPKLADIGLVASLGQRSYVGTDGYVPPEGPGSPGADVYSLGKVMYEIAMGRDRLEFPELATKLDEHPDRKRLLALNQVLLKACAKDTGARYRTAREIQADLLALECGRRPRMRVPWAALAGLAAICAAGAIVWNFRAAPHPQAIPGILQIETDPPGAMVIFGDRMSRSPALFDSVEAGTYPLHIAMPGYEPIDIKIDSAAPPAPFHLQRSKGSLSLTAEPPGATEYDLSDHVTRLRHGTLPAVLRDLPTGSYEILAHRGGRTAWKTVAVERGRETAVAFDFASVGVLCVTSDPPGAEIFVDGTSRGRTPLALYLPTGSCEVLARYGSWPEDRREAAIQSGTNAPVEFVFRNGSVKITSAPGGATVLRSGAALGRTPLLIDEVSPGPVSYELRLAGYADAIVTGTVAPREQAFLAARLEKKFGPEPGKPWQNSLGMKFVPLGDIDFSIWDTRVSDYDAFCAATGRIRPKTDFEQGPSEPAVLVSWNDATAFCQWLTEKEMRDGALQEGQLYRLPTDAEWSAAAGMAPEGGATPEERDGKRRGEYPWGKAWPPPPGSGNFADESARRNGRFIEGYNDGWAETSPAGAFPANRLGIFDMSGNVWQWVQDGYDGAAGHAREWGVLRGGSWGTSSRGELESSYRNVVDRDDRDVIYGFRCVLVPRAGN